MNRYLKSLDPYLSTLALMMVLTHLTSDISLSGQGFPGRPAELFATRIPYASTTRYLLDERLSRGKFLVAGREMKDPRFVGAVIFLVDYGPHGVMGLVINRPTKVRLSTVFPGVEGLEKRPDTFYYGGPVRPDQIFVLIRSWSRPEDSHHVYNDIFISSSKELLARMIKKGETAKSFHVFAGYSGWGPGQLEREVALGSWHVLPADAETIFEKEPSEVWHELIRRSSLKWIRAPGAGEVARARLYKGPLLGAES